VLRGLLLLTLAALVVSVLYFPSTISDEDYVRLLQEERAAVSSLWGDGQAVRIENFSRSLYRASLDPPVPGPLGKPELVDAANKVAGSSSEQLAARLGNNDYARSLAGALSLAAYRVAAFLMFMPFFLPFTVAAVVDGLTERKIRSVGFANDSAGLYGMYAGCAVALLCFGVLLLAWPGIVPATLLALIPISVAFLIGRAAANFRQVL